MNTDFHPDYGYPEAFREKVVNTALDIGVSEAARNNGVAENTVRTWLNRYQPDWKNIVPRKPAPGYAQSYKDKVVEEYMKGTAVSDIAKLFTVSKGSVYNWVRKY